MVVDVDNDDRFPPLEPSDVYVYLHEDGTLTVTRPDGKIMQRPLADVIATIHRAQQDGGRAWISGQDSPMCRAAVDSIHASDPQPLEPWSTAAPPVRWDNAACGLLAAALHGQDDVLDDLIDRGVDLSWRDDDNNTALHCATYGSNAHAAQRLVRAGAPMDERNAQGYTPEMYSLAQGTDEITRLLLERHDVLLQTRRRFRNGHWLLPAVGVPVFVAFVLVMAGLTIVGLVPPIAAVAAVGIPSALLALSWMRVPPRLASSAYAIDGATLTILRGAFRRATVDLRTISAAAHFGPTATQSYVPGVGYVVIPSELGRVWPVGQAKRIGSHEGEEDVVSTWPSTLLIEYDRMWRDEVVLPIARHLVLARADITDGLRTEIKSAVMQAAKLATGDAPEVGRLRRWARMIRTRYRR